MDKKAKFLRVYSQLPDALLDQIIVYVDEKPYTWRSVFFEVKNDTPLSKKILNTLSDMDII